MFQATQEPTKWFRSSATVITLFVLWVATPSTQTARSPRNANYSIDITLDHQTRTLRGRELVTWRNTSSQSTAELHFHLYYNAWKNTRSTWMKERLLGRGLSLHNRPESDWGWTDISSISLVGTDDTPATDLTNNANFIAPDDGNPDDQTVLRVQLPYSVSPDETITLEIEWTARVPRTFARTGTIGNYYFIAQWYPKLGVFAEDGWICHQFHTATNFFADYGVYDVRLTVPSEWILGATGQEQRVTDNRDGTATHHYYAEDVHDFAWTTSPDFLDLQSRFEHPELPDVNIRLLLQPEHRDQAERHFEATRQAFKYYGEWFGAYPYDNVTVIDPAWQSSSGGMEYPTLFTSGTRWLAPTTTNGPEQVTVHEAGHQFFYGVIGNNEVEHAWLDEGLNTFATARTVDQYFPHYWERRFFGSFVPWTFTDISWSRALDGSRLARYRTTARMDIQATPTFQYWPGSMFSTAYYKTTLWLHTLERFLGWETLRQGMSDYYARWTFAHPEPQDFFDSINAAAGENLAWFFDQVHGDSAVFDYGIAQVTNQDAAGKGFFRDVFINNDSPVMFETVVVARRYGDGTFPVDVVVEFADGHRELRSWDGRTQWTTFKFEHSARAISAIVDPERVLMLDINYTNNSWTSSPRATDAATKWTLAWIVWLQDLLLTSAFIV